MTFGLNSRNQWPEQHIIPVRDEAQCQELGAFLADRIYEFNAVATGYSDGKLLAGCVRSDTGAVIAGFSGHTWGGCCELSHVWVHERYRGQGLGALLLRSAEAEAVAKPKGHSDIIFVKVLAERPRAGEFSHSPAP